MNIHLMYHRQIPTLKVEWSGTPLVQHRPRLLNRAVFDPSKERKIELKKLFLEGTDWNIRSKGKCILNDATDPKLRIQLPLGACHASLLFRFRATKLYPEEKPCTRRIDLSNLVKLVEDAFNGTIWEDDKNIILLTARKISSPEAGTTLLVHPAEIS